MASKFHFRNGSSVSRFAVPFRSIIQRFIFFFLVAASISFMLLARNESVFIEKTSNFTTDIFAPVLEFVSRPVASVEKIINKIDDLSRVYSENARLKQENERLKGWEAVARDLSYQNRLLKSLTHFSGDSQVEQLTARVVGDAGGPFVRSVIINVGSLKGIKKNHAVVTGDGLVGRVISVGLRSARILLITDINSRIPVAIEESRDRAILAGNNIGQPRLTFLPVTAAVKEGDRIVTSGEGGVFPPGLPVGTIVNSGESGIRISPLARLENLEFVSVIKRDIPGSRGLGEKKAATSDIRVK